MNLRRLGVTGLPVSVLGFGCGAIGGLLTKGHPEEQRDAIATALGAGINYFDTAPLYGNGASESNLGRVFAEMGGLPRGVVIGTKVRIDPAQAKYAPATIRSSMEDSLARLRMDRVDLLQLHTSITEHSGRGVTVSDVLGPIMDGLEAVRDAGLASWVGITANGDTEAVREVVRSGRTATAQIMLNALNPSAGWAHHLAPGGHDFSGLIRDTIAHEVGVIVIRSLAPVPSLPRMHAIPTLANRRGLPESVTTTTSNERADCRQSHSNSAWRVQRNWRYVSRNPRQVSPRS